MTRMRITELGEQIHGVYRELFEVSVRIIEQTLHGSVARGGKARAEHLASVAKGMELKLQYVALFLDRYNVDFLPRSLRYPRSQRQIHHPLNPHPIPPKLIPPLQQNPLPHRPNPNKPPPHNLPKNLPRKTLLSRNRSRIPSLHRRTRFKRLRNSRERNVRNRLQIRRGYQRR